MLKKSRTQIVNNIAAEILFLSDRTCCVCNARGKQVQIHHIDENPTNNSIDNLAILCFDCHDQTMIKGGFGRKLDSAQINKYRADWLERVKNQKEKADEIASIQKVTGTIECITENLNHKYLYYKTNDDPELLKYYLDKILIIHQAQLSIAQTKWDTGVTLVMNQANSDMIDFYEEVLIELSTFYPEGHFDNQAPKKYFQELISSRFSLHRLILEPEGVGTGGTMVSTMTGGNVMTDLKEMIIYMVNSLLWSYEIEEQIDLNKWREEWRK